jgi:hypothetical protein
MPGKVGDMGTVCEKTLQKNSRLPKVSTDTSSG